MRGKDLDSFNFGDKHYRSLSFLACGPGIVRRNGGLKMSNKARTPQERINAIARFVKAQFDHVAEEDPACASEANYRWLHTLRVSNYAKTIAEMEGANVELVIVSGLLHDIAHFEQGEYRDHGRTGARIARSILRDAGYRGEEVESICYAIAVHVDGIADFTHPHSWEAEVVSDADNIDRFGPYRVIQSCSGYLDHYPDLLEFVRKRITVLDGYLHKNPLGTEGGRRIFEEQLDLQTRIFRALLDQSAYCILPSIRST
jgi:putative nucleotidyltransferase with HDIG domain